MLSNDYVPAAHRPTTQLRGYAGYVPSNSYARVVARGLGPLQRWTLDYLAGAGGGSLSIKLELLGDDSVRAQEASLRRAIAALARWGLVRTGYEVGDGFYVYLIAWLPNKERPSWWLVQRRRWRRCEGTILDVLRRITRGDVDVWLAAGRGVRGYAREHPVPRQNRGDEPPLLPYQLAVERIVAELGGRDSRGRLMPSTSRAIRHALQRLAERYPIVLHESNGSSRHLSMLHCLPEQALLSLLV